MTETDDAKLGGNAPVEIDQTFVGGKYKNMHKSKRIKGMSYAAGNGKAIVMGMLERGGKVRAGSIVDRKLGTMRPPVENNVAAVRTSSQTSIPAIPSLPRMLSIIM